MKHLDLLRTVIAETFQSLHELRDGRWKNMLMTYMVFTALFMLTLPSLTALLVQSVVSLSGQSALTDTEIIYFFLTPEGALAGILLASITLTFALLTYSALLVASRASALGLRGEFTHIFYTITTRFWQLLRLSVRFTISVVALALPFLLGIWVSYELLISDKDINFYLSTRPLSLWAFLAIFSGCTLSFGVLLIKRTLRWFYAIPLVLFTEMNSRQAKHTSRTHTMGQQRRIMYWLALWLFGTPLLISTLNAPLNLTASWIATGFANNLPLLALTIGLTLGLTSMTSFFVSFTTLSTLARQNVKMLIETGLESAGEKSHSPPAYHHIPLNQKYLCIAAVLLLFGASGFSYIWLSNFRLDDSVMVIAHRGASAEAPENSIAAIQRAIDADSDWVEIDVQETAEGEVIVFHDKDFSRLANSPLATWKVLRTQLPQIDIGNNQSPPTLQQALALCKNKSKVLIELKHYGNSKQLEQRVIDIVEQAGMQSKVALMSLDYDSVQKIRQLRPSWKVGLLSTLTLGDITELDVDFIAINSSSISPKLVKKAHRDGVEIYAWTVNDPLDISAMTSRGVDAIITDDPAKAHKVLQQRAALPSGPRLLLELAHTFGRNINTLE